MSFGDILSFVFKIYCAIFIVKFMFAVVLIILESFGKDGK